MAQKHGELKLKRSSDNVAIFISAVSLIISVLAVVIPLYWSDFHRRENLTAMIVGLEPGSDTNGFYTVEVGLILRNEGNRETVIPGMSLVLAETSTFNLPVPNSWSRITPIIVAPKQTIYEKIVFGAGRHKYQMIETRRPDKIDALNGEIQIPIDENSTTGKEPIIYGKLTIDTVDTDGKLNITSLYLGNFQRIPGLKIRPAFKTPYTFQLLPSKMQSPLGGIYRENVSGSIYTVKNNTNRWSTTATGPLGTRINGIYTNEQDKGWPVQVMSEHLLVGFQSDFINTNGKIDRIYFNWLLPNPNKQEIELVISPNGLHVASLVVIQPNDQQLVILDGKTGPEFDGIGSGSLLFSGDSKHLAYSAIRSNKCHMVLDGKEDPQFEGIGVGTLLFSADSTHFAYAAMNHGKQFMILDGKPGPEFDGIAPGSIAFSGDSQHLMYLGGKAGKQSLVIDGIVAGNITFRTNGPPEIISITNMLGVTLGYQESK